MTENYELDKLVIASLKNAINGQIFPNLRGITVDWNQSKLHLTAYINGEITESTTEQLNDVETYFLSHILDSYQAHFEIKRVDYPKKIQCLNSL